MRTRTRNPPGWSSAKTVKDFFWPLTARARDNVIFLDRLRQVDVKAEHFERTIARIEQERDEWEKKAGEAEDKFKQSKAELDEVNKRSPLRPYCGLHDPELTVFGRIS